MLPTSYFIYCDDYGLAVEFHHACYEVEHFV